MDLDLSKCPIEDLYLKIANIVVESIGNNRWSVATIHAVVNNQDDVTFQGSYKTAKNDTINYFDLPFTIFDFILELRKRLGDKDNARFKEIYFILDSSGKFDIKIKY